MNFLRKLVCLVLVSAACGATSASATPASDAGPWDHLLPLSELAAMSLAAPEALVDAAVPAAAPAVEGTAAHLRNLLAEFAVTLRDIRYRRGGKDPATGFDCSGFVRYVFRQTVGEDLAQTSASQFREGEAIQRGEMKTGDLVFFRTRGKQISHVGIYLDHGRFIHSPSSGKRISINRLDEAYWAKRFVGAKRPNVLS